jgi:hypothetical protein
MITRSPDHVVAVVTDSAKDMNAFGRQITSQYTSHHSCLSKFNCIA